MKKKVLILGAGYGGVFAAAYLCKEKEYYDITLIDQNSHLELIQQISYIVLGSKDAGDVTVRIDDLFRNEIGKGQLEFVEALVKSIDLDNKTVEILFRRTVNISFINVLLKKIEIITWSKEVPSPSVH